MIREWVLRRLDAVPTAELDREIRAKRDADCAGMRMRAQRDRLLALNAELGEENLREREGLARAHRVARVIGALSTCPLPDDETRPFGDWARPLAEALVDLRDDGWPRSVEEARDGLGRAVKMIR